MSTRSFAAASIALAITALAIGGRAAPAEAGMIPTPAPPASVTPSPSGPPWWETATPPAYTLGNPPIPVQVTDDATSQVVSYWSTQGGAPSADQPDLVVHNAPPSTTDAVSFDLSALDVGMTFVDGIVLEGAFPGTKITIYPGGRFTVPRPGAGFNSGGNLELKIALLGSDGHRYLADVDAQFWALERSAVTPAPTISPAPVPTPTPTPSASATPVPTPSDDPAAATDPGPADTAAPTAADSDEPTNTDAGVAGWAWDFAWPSALWAIVIGAAYLYLQFFQPRPKHDNQGNPLSPSPASTPAA